MSAAAPPRSLNASCQLHPGRTGERLDRELAERKAIAGLAEDLAGAALIVRRRAIEETREGDGAVRVDGVERVCAATTQIERAEIPAAISRDMPGLDSRSAAPIVIVA